VVSTLLVPLDGSELAEQALPHAERLARASAARLVLTRATLIRTLPRQNHERARERALHEAEQYLQALAAGLAERGVDVAWSAPYGEAARAILEQVHTQAADVVVMTSHGRSGLGRWLYGSVAEAVLARSPVPVLLTRAWPTPAPGRELGRKARLLVPLDGSAFAEAALPAAQRLAAILGGEVVLTHTVVPPWPSPSGEQHLERAVADLELAIAEASKYLDQVAQDMALTAASISVDVRVGDPVRGIAAAGRGRQAALVVMATHGGGRLQRLLLGSVAAGVLQHGGLPVMLVRPEGVWPAADLLPEEERPAASASSAKLMLSEDELVLVRTALQAMHETAPGQPALHARAQRLLEKVAGDPLGAEVAPVREQVVVAG
jgi:nucleotide-binding universal stress UspA family protein